MADGLQPREMWSHLDHKKKRKLVIFDYMPHATILKCTKTAKYLGVNVIEDISWNIHIKQITTKSNYTLKFINQNIQAINKKMEGISLQNLC